jgi:hypothetical protein
MSLKLGIVFDGKKKELVKTFKNFLTTELSDESQLDVCMEILIDFN